MLLFWNGSIHGKEIEGKLLFQAAAVRLIYVFTRLRHHGYIVQPEKEIRDWLCANFNYLKRSERSIKPIDAVYCLNVLSKEQQSMAVKNIIPVEGLATIRNQY